jgi:hypothetical protein
MELLSNLRGLISMKREPDYWWDFDKDMNVIIESDDDRYPIVRKYIYNEEENLDQILPQVEALINDLYAGRTDFKKLGLKPLTNL